MAVATARETILKAEGVHKWFGPTHANDGVDLELVACEVHALLGQNGAGKSTLVGIMVGRFEPDAGRVLMGGAELSTGDPRAAAALGIATVFQDLMLVPSMTGLENVALALGLAATRETRSRVERVQREFELPAAMDVPVVELEVPERQRIELVRALSQEPKVLLLDEPTSLLPPSRVEPFLQGVRGLAQRGLAVLLITHRLDEARMIADRITIMRQGQVVASHARDDFPSSAELAMEMLGRRLVERHEIFEPAETVLLAVQGLTVKDSSGHVMVDDVSLEVRQGEVVGVAGVDGNGQLELLEAIAGLQPPAEGRIVFGGEDITREPAVRRFRRGIVIVSGDRRRHEIVPSFLVADHFEYVLGPRVVRRLPGVLRQYGVWPPMPAWRGDQLSGGNQQKMILARACEAKPRVLLASYPMHGLDVQASLNVRELLLARAAEGAAIVVASSDLDELLSISHRILVMSRGRVMGVQDRAHIDHEQLARWFTGSQTAA